MDDNSRNTRRGSTDPHDGDDTHATGNADGVGKADSAGAGDAAPAEQPLRRDRASLRRGNRTPRIRRSTWIGRQDEDAPEPATPASSAPGSTDSSGSADSSGSTDSSGSAAVVDGDALTDLDLLFNPDAGEDSSIADEDSADEGSGNRGTATEEPADQVGATDAPATLSTGWSWTDPDPTAEPAIPNPAPSRIDARRRAEQSQTAPEDVAPETVAPETAAPGEPPAIIVPPAVSHAFGATPPGALTNGTTSPNRDVPASASAPAAGTDPGTGTALGPDDVAAVLENLAALDAAGPSAPSTSPLTPARTAQMESAPTDPARTESAPTEPAATAPATTGPAATVGGSAAPVASVASGSSASSSPDGATVRGSGLPADEQRFNPALGPMRPRPLPDDPASDRLDLTALILAIILPPIGFAVAIMAWVRGKERRGWASDRARWAVVVSIVMTLLLIVAGVIAGFAADRAAGLQAERDAESAAHASIVEESAAFCAAAAATPHIFSGDPDYGWPALTSDGDYLAAVRGYADDWATIADAAPPALAERAAAVAERVSGITELDQTLGAQNRSGDLLSFHEQDDVAAVAEWHSDYCIPAE